MTNEEKVIILIERLSKLYPDAHTALQFENPLQLLIATIMSAQTTDKLVNKLTPELFKRYKTAKDFADADREELEKRLLPVNFYKNKAKNIKAASKIIDEKHGGEVPSTMEELDSLPGVARKTANVVLGNAFHKAEGIAVDTHVRRLSNKLGLTKSQDPVKIEQDLMKIVPKDKWIIVTHLLVNFGREYCPARPHKCDTCPLSEVNLCPDK